MPLKGGVSSGSALFAKMKILRDKIYHNSEISTCDPLKHKKYYPIIIVSMCLAKSIRIKRVKHYIVNGPLEPVHEIWVLIAYAQGLIFNMHAQLPSRDSGLIVDMNLYLLLYFMYDSIEGSDETVHMCSLIRALAAPLCDN